MMGGEFGFALRVGGQWLSPVAVNSSYRWIIPDKYHCIIGVEMKPGVTGCRQCCDAVLIRWRWREVRGGPLQVVYLINF